MTHWEYLKTLDADSAAMYILSNLPTPDVRLIGRKCSINGDVFKDWLNSKILYKTSDGDYIDMFELLCDDIALTIAGLKISNESEHIETNLLDSAIKINRYCKSRIESKEWCGDCPFDDGANCKIMERPDLWEL